MANELIVGEGLEILDRVLAHQDEAGDFLGSDVHTYHLIEALHALGPASFSAYIDQAASWFESLDDPRDRNPRSVSPFKLLALTRTGRGQGYRSEAIRKILAHMVGSEGNINVPIGFVESPDTYDTFPTLVGAQILLGGPPADLAEVIRNAISWSIRKLNDINRPATTGFLCWIVSEALEAGITLPSEARGQALQSLRRVLEDVDALLSDPLQGAYVVFDAAIIGRKLSDSVCVEAAPRLLIALLNRRKEDENFYKKTDQALLDLRLLAAIGATMTAEDRAAFEQRLLAGAFAGKVAATREYRRLRSEAQRLVERLRALEGEKRGEGLFVKPRWPLPSHANKARTVFWLMPFPKDRSASNLRSMEDVFQSLLRPSIEKEFSVSVVRADDIFDVGEIMQSIWEKIVLADVLVADLTDRNPNVFYEVGLADALNKEVILLSQSIEDVPFDLRARRVLIYTVNYPGPDKLRKELLKTLETVIERSD